MIEILALRAPTPRTRSCLEYCYKEYSHHNHSFSKMNDDRIEKYQVVVRFHDSIPIPKDVTRSNSENDLVSIP